MPVRTPMYELPLSESDQKFVLYFNQCTRMVLTVFGDLAVVMKTKKTVICTNHD